MDYVSINFREYQHTWNTVVDIDERKYKEDAELQRCPLCRKL